MGWLLCGTMWGLLTSNDAFGNGCNTPSIILISKDEKEADIQSLRDEVQQRTVEHLSEELVLRSIFTVSQHRQTLPTETDI